VNWAPARSSEGNLVAVGLHNGKVQLVNFSGGNKIVQEFSPRHSRTCNAIAWNPVYTNQIAAGLDKVRGDCSTLVWDLNRGIAASPSSHQMNMHIGGGNTAGKTAMWEDETDTL
jgi:WD repeat-containing protein mio